MNIAILLYPGVTALDIVGPYEVFNILRKFNIQLVWKEIGPVPSDGKALVLGATHTLAEVDRCDVLLIPGSSTDTLTMMADREVIQWIKKVHAHTQWTASICSGALVLGATGLLEGHVATTHWAAMSGLRRVGASPEPAKRIVQSDKIITAAGVSAGIDLALHLVAKLLGPEQAWIAQLMIEYDPEPPFDSGNVSKSDASVVQEATENMKRLAIHNPKNITSISKLLMRRWLKMVVRARRK